jgi:hypothetical protein
VRSDCTFVYSLKNERCDETFQQVDNAAREASKATIESGKFRIKVVQTKGQSVSTKFIRPDFPYVSSEDVDGVVTRALKSFNFAELNTTAVSVGSKVVRFGAHLSGQSPLPDYPIRLERSSLASARADGKITVTELCGGDQQKPGCSNTVAKFKYVEQEFKDDVLPIRVALKATYP